MQAVLSLPWTKAHDGHSLLKKKKQTRIDVYETLCPQQMLVHKGGKIKNLGGECRDVTPTKLQSQNIFKESTHGGRGGGGQDGCERRIEVFVKIQKKIGGGGAGQDGWERRIEVFVNIQKNILFFWWWGGGGGSGRGVGLGGGGVQGRCGERSEVFVKIKKKIVGGVGSVREGGGGFGLGGQGECE